LVGDDACLFMHRGCGAAESVIRLQIPSKPLAATGVVAVGALWVIMAAALVWATEFLQGKATKCAHTFT